jgi:hypothetical protein
MERSSSKGMHWIGLLEVGRPVCPKQQWFLELEGDPLPVLVMHNGEHFTSPFLEFDPAERLAS